jgi:hypothetical protein
MFSTLVTKAGPTQSPIYCLSGQERLPPRPEGSWREDPGRFDAEAPSEVSRLPAPRSRLRIVAAGLVLLLPAPEIAFASSLLLTPESSYGCNRGCCRQHRAPRPSAPCHGPAGAALEGSCGCHHPPGLTVFPERPPGLMPSTLPAAAERSKETPPSGRERPRRGYPPLFPRPPRESSSPSIV